MADSRNKLSDEFVVGSVTDCLKRHVQRGQTLSVAYSGGLDSTVLLHALKSIAAALDISLSSIHVHHGLSTNADAWVVHCERSCADLGIELRVVRIQVEPEHGEGVEAAARNARLQALLDTPAHWIAMAHHADDQAETVMHNLLRGTGPRGAAAIPEVRERIVRPLLKVPRSHLLAYAKQHDLKWVEDESNSDRRFTRNFLRHEVMPILTKRFPQAVEQLSTAARRFGEAQRLLDELALLDLVTDNFSFPVELRLLRQLPELRVRNAVRALVSHQGVQLPSERRLNEFVRQLRMASSDRHPCLNLGTYTLWVEEAALHFRMES
jgi:tRNA(Ile)-lysidine synthase